jgi:triosephosphate isomerase (TIM)
MSLKKKWVMANWKMNGSLEMTTNYIHELNALRLNDQHTEVVIFPPAVYLPTFQQKLKNHACKYGAQNVHSEAKGAFTGEISTSMVKSLGCEYVLIGHSERRHIFGEDDNFIAKKFHNVKSHDMIPVICIGETLNEYQTGQTTAVLERQLHRLNDDLQSCIIAYEPVWAIGTGLRPTNQELETTFNDIKEILLRLNVKYKDIPMLYGGSVTAENIKTIMSLDACQGVLVGGASLDITQMLEIIECITYC